MRRVLNIPVVAVLLLTLCGFTRFNVWSRTD